MKTLLSNTQKAITYSLVALDRQYKMIKDEKFVIVVIRFQVYGKKVQYSTGEWVNLKKWQDTNQFKNVRSNSPEYAQRQSMQDTINRIDEISKEIMLQGETPSINKIKERLKGGYAEPEKEKSIFSVFPHFETNFKNKKRKAVSWCVYHTVFNVHFKNFLFTHNDYKPQDLALSEMKKSLLPDFRDYLYNQVSIQSANKMLTAFCNFFHFCVERDYLVYYPFGKTNKEKPKGIKPIISFSITEIKQLKNLILKPELEKTRDALLMSCASGLAHTDLTSLKPEHVLEDKISKFRDKTGVLCEPPLNDTSRFLIKKYSEQCKKTGFCFPQINILTGRKHIIRIMKLAGIKKHIGWHTGRHTYAVQCIRDGVSIPVLKKFIGHKPESTETFKYTQSVESETQMEQAVQLNQSFAMAV